MRIKVLASGSGGNCYWVSDGQTPLLLECGIRVERILDDGNGFRLADLGGCLISHEHGDHSKSAAALMHFGVDCYMSQGTANALGLAGHRLKVAESMEPLDLGTWLMVPFDTVHDASEPLGFLMESLMTGEKLLYLTDSAYCRYRFRGVSHLLVECNHSVELLRRNVAEGRFPLEHKNRVLRNHMSIERLLDMLRANDLSAVREIHLLHLSDDNADEAEFKRRIQAATGKPVYVAPAGLS